MGAVPSRSERPRDMRISHAKLISEEDIKGPIEPGKLADCINGPASAGWLADPRRGSPARLASAGCNHRPLTRRELALARRSCLAFGNVISRHAFVTL